jgi:anti-sigma B factor antagonist
MSSADTVIARVEDLPDGKCVALAGEIDYHRSPEMRSQMLAVIAARPKRLVIDMTAVPYMDSSGVATLVETLTAINRAGGKLVLCGLQPKVRSIFQIAKLDSVFKIVPDAAAARTA